MLLLLSEEIGGERKKRVYLYFFLDWQNGTKTKKEWGKGSLWQCVWETWRWNGMQPLAAHLTSCSRFPLHKQVQIPAQYAQFGYHIPVFSFFRQLQRMILFPWLLYPHTSWVLRYATTTATTSCEPVVPLCSFTHKRAHTHSAAAAVPWSFAAISPLWIPLSSQKESLYLPPNECHPTWATDLNFVNIRDNPSLHCQAANNGSQRVLKRMAAFYYCGLGADV